MAEKREDENRSCEWCGKRPQAGMYKDEKGDWHCICIECACGLPSPTPELEGEVTP